MNTSPDRVITAAVFDIGGVLLDWNPRYLYRKLIPDPAQMEWFLGTVCTPQWHDAHDRGAGMRESCAALARQWPDYAEHPGRSHMGAWWPSLPLIWHRGRARSLWTRLYRRSPAIHLKLGRKP